MDLRLQVVDRVREVPRAAWDALVGERTPFLEWAWLDCLEEAGCVGGDTGWLPQHLTAWTDGVLVGACPLYVKGHSHGEFVFDHGWASAALRAGIAYYPKLLVAVPFTPVTGARFLAASPHEGAVAEAFAAALEDLCGSGQFSSAHVNFCGADEAAALGGRGWLCRAGYQYHWANDGFGSFDDYLASLRSKRRNQVRREQRELAEQGVVITSHVGGDIPDGVWPLVYRLYRATVDANPWGQRYLNQRFFTLVGERYRERICLILARQDGAVVAGTFNVQKGDALYGRYWGTLRPLRHLHFNVCYYAAIAHAITAGLGRFEPGAGGEFKHLRGFDARETRSMHWIQEPRLRAAIDDFLAREGPAVAAEIEWLDGRSALRRRP